MGWLRHRALAAQGADVHGRDVIGNTLLHIAVRSDDSAYVQWVLQQGVPMDAFGADNLTALQVTESEDVALVLLKAGADASLVAKGSVAFRKKAELREWWVAVDWLDEHIAKAATSFDKN